MRSYAKKYMNGVHTEYVGRRTVCAGSNCIFVRIEGGDLLSSSLVVVSNTAVDGLRKAL